MEAGMESIGECYDKTTAHATFLIAAKADKILPEDRFYYQQKRRIQLIGTAKITNVNNS